MDTHLLVQCIQLRERNLLRMIPIEHSSLFLKEFNTLYPDIENANIIIFYNSGKYFNRISKDLQYKNFKNVQIKPVLNGLWEVIPDKNQQRSKCSEGSEPFDNESLTKWFYNNIQPFIQLKMNSYFEDSELEISFFDKIKQYIDTHSNYKNSDFEKYAIIIDRDYIELKNPEKTKDNLYVLNIHEIVSLYIQSLFYFNFYIDEHIQNTIKKELSTPPIENETVSRYNDINDSTDTMNDKDNRTDIVEPPLEVTICEFTNNCYINKAKLHYTEVINLFYKHLGITNQHIHQTKITYLFNRFIELNDLKGYDNTPIFWRGTPMTPQFEPSLFTYFHTILDDTISPTHVMESVAAVNNESPKKDIKVCEIFPTLLYKNNITNEVKKSFDTIEYHKEFDFISDISVKSDIGNSMIDMIHRVNSENINDIVSDIEKFLNIIQSIHNIGNFVEQHDVHHIQYDNDPQKKFTKQFVDAFKDDLKETVASLAIQNAFTYVSNFIEPMKINMNKLGKDLVDLGVKKQRKARGFVYGIQLPSPKEMEELFMRNAAEVFSDNQSNEVHKLNYNSLKKAVVCPSINIMPKPFSCAYK